MKVLLTHTYFLAEDAHEQQIMKPYPPLGLLYLSAYLKENQIDVSVYDTTFSTYDELVRHIDEQRPAVLGIHCNLLTKFTVMRLIQHCQLRGIISILGGPDAATQVAEFLNYGADIIVSGEGEIPLLAVLKRLETHAPTDLGDIPNVSYKTANGRVIQNPRQASRLRLDDFPLPDRDAIDLEKYLGTWEKYHGQRSISLITARGCAFTCKWCSHSVYGHTHRRRRPENVVAEIQLLVERYRPTHLWFADDVFTVNKHWLKKFNGLMRDAGIHLPFECIARADKFDEEIAILLKDLGCYRVWFGAESGSQKILDAMSRGVTKAEIADATRWSQQNGLQAGYFVMFGYPGEAIEDMYETIEFVRDQQPDIYLTTVAYPLRGTALFDELKSQVKYQNGWETHLQRELDIRGRFTAPLYQCAVKKLASEYRQRQLKSSPQELPKRVYHALRSAYMDFRIRRLAHLKT
ncbi:MAG: radical SAM protein [Calditrichia bacterium]